MRAQDDCCQGEASTSSQAVMYNAVKAIDPWHIIIGALQCMQEFWQSMVRKLVMLFRFAQEEISSKKLIASILGAGDTRDYP